VRKTTQNLNHVRDVSDRCSNTEFATCSGNILLTSHQDFTVIFEVIEGTSLIIFGFEKQQRKDIKLLQHYAR